MLKYCYRGIKTLKHLINCKEGCVASHNGLINITIYVKNKKVIAT